MKETEKITIGGEEHDFIPYTPERFMKYVTEGAERFGMTVEEYIEAEAGFWEKEGRPEIAEEVRSVYRETIELMGKTHPAQTGFCRTRQNASEE